MSKPVTKIEVGKNFSMSSDLLGQPKVEKGQSPDENHVSRTSVSCVKSVISPYFSLYLLVASVIFYAAMNLSLSLFFQIGILLPHQS